MYYWLLLLGFIGVVGLVIALICFITSFLKDKSDSFLSKKDYLKLGITTILIGIFVVIFMFGFLYYDSNPKLSEANPTYSSSWDVTGKEYFYIIFFGFLCGISSSTLIISGMIANEKINLNKRIRRYLKTIEYVSIPLVVISFIFAIQGMANNLYYPLLNGITFGSNGVKLIRYNEASSGFITIKFYGVLIVSGFLVAYAVSEKYFFKRYGQHGLMDLMLIVVLIFGLLGARFWYCYVLEFETYKNNFLSVLKVWEGGLAIEGGALFGIFFGGLYFLLFNKKVSVRNALDFVVPSILFGQIIGRIGNFLNHEVYGAEVARETFSFFPTLVLNQMSVNWSDVGGRIYVPLFLIEMIVNLCGYFLIRYAIGMGLKKFRSMGDLACIYVSFYGMVRVVMEPLRDSQFGYTQSYIASWCMFGGGIAILIGLHIYDFIRYGKDDLVIHLISLLSNKPVYLKDGNLGPYKGKDTSFLHNGKRPQPKEINI